MKSFAEKFPKPEKKQEDATEIRSSVKYSNIIELKRKEIEERLFQIKQKLLKPTQTIPRSICEKLLSFSPSGPSTISPTGRLLNPIQCVLPTAAYRFKAFEQKRKKVEECLTKIKQ